MPDDVDVLHHIGLIGRDLARLAAQYEHLGFFLTPVSVPHLALSPGAPPEPVGAGNRHAIFRDNYLELLGVLDRARWDSIPMAQKGPFDLDRPLARYEGLHVLHLGTDDLDAVHRRLSHAGLSPSAIRPFQRPVDTETGPQMMRARTLSFPQGLTPEALFQIAEHQTPELVLQPRFMHHPNGAKLLLDVIMCVADIDEAASRYGAIAGTAASSEGASRRLRLGRSDVVITDAAGLADLLPDPEVPALPFLAGFTLGGDLRQAKAYFAATGIPTSTHGDAIVVRPAQSAGTFIRFVERSAG